MKVAIINYGLGNLGSVRRALTDLGADVVVAEHPIALFDANRIVLPGVGAFGEGMARLRAGGWVDALRYQVVEAGKPLLGICLGMQMLATASEENGVSDGLGLIPGRVRRLDELGCSLRIPHVGWNEVRFDQRRASLFDEIPQATDFYFVHSYALVADDAESVCATTTYGSELIAAVQKGHVFGTQFHPEKSSKAGRQILRNFLDVVAC
jgi:imidazole glycerol-phosphate synthase subunit HisH